MVSLLGSIGKPVAAAYGGKHESTSHTAHTLMDYAVGMGGSFTENIGMKVVESIYQKRALRKRAKQAKEGVVEDRA
jgi:hypothetical protein